MNVTYLDNNEQEGYEELGRGGEDPPTPPSNDCNWKQALEWFILHTRWKKVEDVCAMTWLELLLLFELATGKEVSVQGQEAGPTSCHKRRCDGLQARVSKSGKSLRH